MISIMKNNLFYFQWYKILFLTMLIDPIFVIYAYSEGLSANYFDKYRSGADHAA